mmetsp:Transcript_23332/g.39865  ORF Transcript_23332/g.39865 Transcript_23332/m.39865 type:complete len:175 (-) Transcript_23332:11-535(-)
MNPTLEALLRRIAAEQAEDAEIVMDMTLEGATKPSNSSKFRDWLVLQEEPVMLCGMLEGHPYVQPINLVAHYSTVQRHRNSYSGEYVGAIGDRDGKDDLGLVCLKKTLFEWQTATLVANADDTSEIAQWFDAAQNSEKILQHIECNDGNTGSIVSKTNHGAGGSRIGDCHGTLH